MDKPETSDVPVGEQLQRAVRDLWSMMIESGDDFVVFMDRRRLNTRIQYGADKRFHVSWDAGDGEWIELDQTFEDPREAAFLGYQGPH